VRADEGAQSRRGAHRRYDHSQPLLSTFLGRDMCDQECLQDGQVDGHRFCEVHDHSEVRVDPCWRARPSSKDVDRSCSPHKLTVTGPPFLSVMLVRGVDLRPLPIVAGNGRLLDVASDSALQTASRRRGAGVQQRVRLKERIDPGDYQIRSV
jgi:hypothetical protein